MVKKLYLDVVEAVLGRGFKAIFTLRTERVFLPANHLPILTVDKAYVFQQKSLRRKFIIGIFVKDIYSYKSKVIYSYESKNIYSFGSKDIYNGKDI